MPESTIRKSKVHFRIVGSGTFTVEHEDGESPADVLKRLVQDKTISLTTLYLHADEFDWKLEATPAMSAREEYERELDDLERQREQMERDEIADAMDQQWNDR